MQPSLRTILVGAAALGAVAVGGATGVLAAVAGSDDAGSVTVSASQVTDAALAVVPGATIERVETDADGAVYEAHLVTSDGAHQTVTFDADLNVVEIQDGPGGGRGPGGPIGAPSDAPVSADSTTTSETSS